MSNPSSIIPHPSSRPLVVDVRHNSLDDGPGVRTAVFFKGCPLKCVWCHNPETISPKAELAWFEKKCLACGACARACPNGAATVGSSPKSQIPNPKSARVAFDRARCQACFACVDGCPSGARKRAGRAVDLDALVSELLKDLLFYRNSGGGVTLSGGEPMMFMEFSGALLRELKAKGVHAIVETCGLFRLDSFVEIALPNIDAVYFDVKFVDPGLHERHTGVGNEMILRNLEELSKIAREKVIPRTPLIPGLTATHENLRAIGVHLRSIGFREARLLPYNPLWSDKAGAVGREAGFHHDGFMKREAVEGCERVFFEALKG